MTVTTIDWGTIAADHGERVFRAARRVVPDDDSAWDCVQEALLTAVRASRPEGIERPVDWLCGVAKNHARHLLRSRGRLRRLLERIRPRVAAPAAAVSLEDRDALSHALGRLPAKERDAVILRYLAGMTPAGVAASQGISEGAARVRVHRGLKRLRGLLGAVGLLSLLAREGVAGGNRARDLATAVRMCSGAAGAAAAALPWLLQPAGLVLMSVLAAGGALTAYGLTPRPADLAPTAAPSILAQAADPGGKPAGEESAPGPRTTRTITIRDLADGKPVPGVALRGVPGGAKAAGSAGTADVPVTAIWKTVEVVSDIWKQLGFTGGEKDADVDLWVYREILVSGTIRFESETTPPSAADVRIWSSFVTGGYGSRSIGGGVEPWCDSWLYPHRMRGSRKHPAPRPDGTFEFPLPAIRGLTIRAYLPGWRADPVAVPFDSARAVGITFVIRRSIRVIGVLRGEGGLPLGNRRLSLWVTKRYKAAKFPPVKSLGVPGLAHTATLSEKDDIGAVNYSLSMLTEPSGRFSAWVPVEGDALFTGFVSGYAPILHHQGELTTDLIGFTIEARKVAEPKRLRILRGGQIASGRKVMFLDLTYSPGGPQPNFTRTTDTKGFVTTENLVAGRRYILHLLGRTFGPREGGVFVWDGQSDVDVKKLPDLK